PQVFDALASLAGRGPGSDVQLGNFTNGGGREEILRETFRAVDQLAIRRLRLFRHPVHGAQIFFQAGVFGPGRFGGRCQAGGQGGRHDVFQVPAPDFGVLVLALDHLALFGQPDLAVYRAGGLGNDGLEAGASAAGDRTAAPVEEAEPDPALLEDLDEFAFRAVERPVGGEIAAVLVAVGIAEHDFLNTALRAPDPRPDFRKVQPRGHDVGSAFEVGNGFEQWHDHQPGGQA